MAENLYQEIQEEQDNYLRQKAEVVRQRDYVERNRESLSPEELQRLNDQINFLLEIEINTNYDAKFV